MRDEADNLLLERARAGDGQAIETLLERERVNPFASGRLYLSMEAEMATVQVAQKALE